MKILIFAHTPPPHHGQSYMVKLMLDGLGGNYNSSEHSAHAGPGINQINQANPGFPVECHHVNCRVSDAMDDIGEVRLEKIWLVLRYCIEAVWCRFRYGVKTFYYVPAPGKRAALYRDWLIMLLCRPFFKEIIFHWHAVGLGDWLHREGFWFEKLLTRILLRHPDLSIVLGVSNMRDALWFETKKLEIVPNGIPDPCADFEQTLLPRRQEHAATLRQLLGTGTPAISDVETRSDDFELYKVLYLAHCTRTKGLFDALEATAIFNAGQAAINDRVRVHLTIAGDFLDPAEEKEFKDLIHREDLKGCVTYMGFVSGDTKTQLLRSSDCLCFPTYYEAEGQPVNIIEAMAFGLWIITTRWRAIPEMLPPDYAGFVSPRTPVEIAAALRGVVTQESVDLRREFLARFSLGTYLGSIRAALHSLHEES